MYHIHLFIHLLMDIWIAFTFGYCEECCEHWFTNTCLSPCFRFFWFLPRSRLARSHVNSMFNIVRYSPTLCTVAVPFYIPTSNIWNCYFQYILFNPYFFSAFIVVIAILLSVIWYIIIILICISLILIMLNIFMCLLVVSYVLWRNVTSDFSL